MPHSPEEKKRAIARLRRIRGQVDGLERAIAAGTACGPVLQQIAALRGAVNGLMAGILDSHLREEFTQVAVDPKIRKQHQASIDQVIALDSVNASSAASCLRAFTILPRLVPAYRALMRNELARLESVDGLSDECREILDRSLGTPDGIDE